LSLSSWYFYLSLVAILVTDILRHRHLECVAAAIACSPLMILLRGDLFYSGPQVIYALVIVQAPLADLGRLYRNRLAKGLIAGAVVYWLASFVYSGDIHSNFRAVELALAASLFYLLASHRVYLLPALLGLACATIVEGFALSANGAMTIGTDAVFRLGLARVEGHSIGNPISFGILTALVFLLSHFRRRPLAWIEHASQAADCDPVDFRGMAGAFHIARKLARGIGGCRDHRLDGAAPEANASDRIGIPGGHRLRVDGYFLEQYALLLSR
jgi:hypothetical protein